MTAPNPSAKATANICNTRGLHARASAKFVKLASTFDAEVHVTRDGVTVNALSIMGLLMLGAGILVLGRAVTAAPDPSAALEQARAEGISRLSLAAVPVPDLGLRGLAGRLARRATGRSGRGEQRGRRLGAHHAGCARRALRHCGRARRATVPPRPMIPPRPVPGRARSRAWPGSWPSSRRAHWSPA